MALVNLGRVKGDPGIPGMPGANGMDGKSVWIKYNNTAQDDGASDVWYSGLNYIGIQTAAGEVKPATGYMWSLFVPYVPVDALTSTRTDVPLSANQGSVLKGFIDKAVVANEAITGATKCKITYDSKGLVTEGENLAVSDIPAGLIQAGAGINVSRTDSGVYTVSTPPEKLIGFRYPQQGTIEECAYSTSDLTLNKGRGKIQVLFLRLSQSNTGYTIDIPVELLILMYHTQQQMDVLGGSDGAISMRVTSCSVTKHSVAHPYLDINVTVNFTYASRGGSNGDHLRAEWWGRPLEPITDATGYY